MLVLQRSEWLEPRGRRVLGYTQASGTRHSAPASAHLVEPDSIRFVSLTDPLDMIVLPLDRVSEITTTEMDPAATSVGVVIFLAVVGIAAVAAASWDGLQWGSSSY